MSLLNVSDSFEPLIKRSWMPKNCWKAKTAVRKKCEGGEGSEGSYDGVFLKNICNFGVRNAALFCRSTFGTFSPLLVTAYWATGGSAWAREDFVPKFAMLWLGVPLWTLMPGQHPPGGFVMKCLLVFCGATGSRMQRQYKAYLIVIAIDADIHSWPMVFLNRCLPWKGCNFKATLDFGRLLRAPLFFFAQKLETWRQRQPCRFQVTPKGKTIVKCIYTGKYTGVWHVTTYLFSIQHYDRVWHGTTRYANMPTFSTRIGQQAGLHYKWALIPAAKD